MSAFHIVCLPLRASVPAAVHVLNECIHQRE